MTGVDPKTCWKGRGMLLMAMVLFALPAVTSSLSCRPTALIWRSLYGATCRPGLCGLIFAGYRRSGFFRTECPVLQVTRGTLAVLLPLHNAVAFAYAPRAEAMAVTFVAPLIVPILGAFFLREYVAPKLWVAQTLGLIGVVILVRPGAGKLHPAIFPVFIAASHFCRSASYGKCLGDPGQHSRHAELYCLCRFLAALHTVAVLSGNADLAVCCIYNGLHGAFCCIWRGADYSRR